MGGYNVNRFTIQPVTKGFLSYIVLHESRTELTVDEGLEGDHIGNVKRLRTGMCNTDGKGGIAYI